MKSLTIHRYKKILYVQHHLMSALLLLQIIVVSHVPAGALAARDNNNRYDSGREINDGNNVSSSLGGNITRHNRTDPDREIDDEGEPTTFKCNAIDGKFRITTGPQAVADYAYEMEYHKDDHARPPTYLASNVTEYIAKGIISFAFQGCESHFDERRGRFLQYKNKKHTIHRHLISTLEKDIIIGFDMAPTVKPIFEVACPETSRDRGCMVFSGGVTIYLFPQEDNNSRRKRKALQQSSSTIQEIQNIIKETIEEEIAQRVEGIASLTYRGQINFPTSLPSQSPSSHPSLHPTESPSFHPSPGPSPIPTILPSPIPTILPSPIPTIRPSPIPTIGPSPIPTIYPSPSPTMNPLQSPSDPPTVKPPGTSLAIGFIAVFFSAVTICLMRAGKYVFCRYTTYCAYGLGFGLCGLGRRNAKRSNGYSNKNYDDDDDDDRDENYPEVVHTFPIPRLLRFPFQNEGYNEFGIEGVNDDDHDHNHDEEMDDTNKNDDYEGGDGAGDGETSSGFLLPQSKVSSPHGSMSIGQYEIPSPPGDDKDKFLAVGRTMG